MREFLLSTCPALLWAFASLEAILVVVLILRWRRTHNVLFLLSGLIVFGLFYDALILALGTVLQEGPLLMGLSRMRFVCHGGLIPLLFPICAIALNFNKTGRLVVCILTGVLVALGIAEGFGTVLAAQHTAGIVRYTSSDATPALVQAVSGLYSYGAVVPLILAGIAVWIRQKTPKLFLSGFLMFLFSALGPATGNFDLIFLISMFGELGMSLFLLLYAEEREKKRAAES